MTMRSWTTSSRTFAWSGWVVFSLLMLPVVEGWAYGLTVAATALILAVVPGSLPRVHLERRRSDLLAIGAFYVATVVLLRVAFVGFTTDHIPGLFLSFAAVLILGVAGPVIYTVWIRRGSLADLGIRSDNWREAAVLGLLFAGVQFSLTLWGFVWPSPSEWVPLLVMAMVVGVFESVFFRGFIQTRLESAFGPVGGVAGAATLYGLYHIGYGMGAEEILFLTGLGVVYAVAFALARNLIVLWPLLTPLGSFYATVDSGDVDLPWASIAGFADVLAVMVVLLILAARHTRRTRSAPAAPTPTHVP